MNETSQEPSVIEVVEAPEILADPALLHKIKLALDDFIVGEDKNKLLLFVIGLTSFMEKPLGAMISGESSAGKSYLMDNVLQFFPNVESYTRMTKASPDRMGKNFNQKILKVGELIGIEAAQAKLRIWISEGSLRLLTTAIDEETGKLSTEEIVTTGTPCFITTTTSIRPDTELLNRLWILSMDESAEQTKAIVQFQINQIKHPNVAIELNPEVKALVERLYITATTHAVIPYADLLSKLFPCDSVKVRRDFKKLLYLTGAIAFLHQEQRPIIRHGVSLYVVSLPVDFFMAWRICHEGVTSTLTNLQLRALQVLDMFEAGKDETTRSVSSAFNKSTVWARQILNALVFNGFLIRNDANKPHTFSLIKKANELGTIKETVSLLCGWGEKELSSYLDNKCKQKQLRKQPFVFSDVPLVDPLTGETIPNNPEAVTRMLTPTLRKSLCLHKSSTLNPKPVPSIDAILNTENSTVPISESSEGAQKAAKRLQKLREQTQKKEET